jgi:RNA recognition motif-containing protein
MGKKLYVGNLPFNTTSEDLQELFGKIGPCDSASVITDRATGRSRGFGFVEMSSASDADKAISQLDRSDFGGRQLTVNEARERTGGGGGGGGGYGGGRGGYGGGGGGGGYGDRGDRGDRGRGRGRGGY